MKWILNSAVITSPGTYTYRLLDLKEAIAWLRAGKWESTIGYQETADALSELSGMPIPVQRRTIRMARGDEALVFRLSLPTGVRRVDPGAKGQLGRDYLLNHAEIGILQRTA